MRRARGPAIQAGRRVATLDKTAYDARSAGAASISLLRPHPLLCSITVILVENNTRTFLWAITNETAVD